MARKGKRSEATHWRADEGSCPICGAAGIAPSMDQSEGTRLIKCLRCGTYEIRESVAQELVDIRRGKITRDRHLVPYLSCYTRQSHGQEKIGSVDTGWTERAKHHLALSNPNRRDHLLLLIEKRAGPDGSSVRIDLEKDGPLVGEPSSRGLRRMLHYLWKKDLIDAFDIPAKTIDDDYPRPGCFALTIDGQDRCDELKEGRESKPDSGIEPEIPASIETLRPGPSRPSWTRRAGAGINCPWRQS